MPLYRVKFFGRVKRGTGYSQDDCRKILDVWAPASSEAINEALRRHNKNGDWLDVSRIEIVPEAPANQKGRML